MITNSVLLLCCTFLLADWLKTYNYTMRCVSGMNWMDGCKCACACAPTCNMCRMLHRHWLRFYYSCSIAVPLISFFLSMFLCKRIFLLSASLCAFNSRNIYINMCDVHTNDIRMSNDLHMPFVKRSYQFEKHINSRTHTHPDKISRTTKIDAIKWQNSQITTAAAAAVPPRQPGTKKILKRVHTTNRPPTQ